MATHLYDVLSGSCHGEETNGRRWRKGNKAPENIKEMKKPSEEEREERREKRERVKVMKEKTEQRGRKGFRHRASGTCRRRVVKTEC